MGLNVDWIEFEIRNSQIVRIRAQNHPFQSSDEWGKKMSLRLKSEIGEPKSSQRFKRELHEEQWWEHYSYWQLLLPVTPHYASVTIEGDTVDARIEFGRERPPQ